MIIGVSDRAAQRQRPAGALRRPHDAADRAAHLALRTARDAALARRAAAQGRPHRGRRRVDRRHGDGAGVRARGRGAGALPRARRGRARELAARGRRRGALPAGPHVPALDGDRERALLRRPRRHRREPHDRRSSCSSTACCCSSSGRSRRSAGSSTSPSARSRRPAARSPGWTPCSRCRRPSSRRTCPRAGSTCASRTSASPTPAARPCCATSTSRSPAGSIVAVCGETGSGKSTMLNLLSRFYDPDSGSVRVGGVEVSALRKADLRTAVALVTQRPVLFSLPLRDNLCAARPEATEEEMLAACEVAGVAALHRRPARRLRHAHRRARRQPLGRAAPARRARARADLERPRARARRPALGRRHRDRGADRARLRPALAGRTVLLSSQRLSTVSLADRAVVLEDGVIVEDAPPSRLLSAGGTFERLFGDEVRVA